MLTFADKEGLSRGFEQYVEKHVKRKGKYYLCPFHNDRDPSANLIISTAGKSAGLPVFFCSSCYKPKADGFWDFLSFIMKFEGVDFKAALEIAQRESGYYLPEWQGKRGKAKRRAPLNTNTEPAKYDLSSGEVDIEAAWAAVFGANAPQTPTNALQGVDSSQVKQTPNQDEKTPTTPPTADLCA